MNKGTSKVVLVEIDHDWNLELGFHGIESDLPMLKAVTIADVVAIAKLHPDRAVLINTLPNECSDRELIGIEAPAMYFRRMIKAAGISRLVHKLPPTPPFEAGVIYDTNLL